MENGHSFDGQASGGNAIKIANSLECQPTIFAKSSSKHARSITTLIGATIPLLIIAFNQLDIYCMQGPRLLR